MNVRDWEATAWDLYPGRRSAQTTRHHRQMVAPFVRAHGHRELADVDRILAQKWALRHPAQVRFLKRLFSCAMRAGLIFENPWTFVDVEQNTRPRVPPTPRQFEAMLAACDARGGWWQECFRSLLVTARYTGARMGGLAGVWPRHVDLEARTMQVTEKGDKTRQVALLGPSLEAVQARLQVVYGRLWVSQQGRPLTREIVGSSFRKVADEARYPGTMHGLKHAAVTWMRDELGASKDDIAIQVGHFDRLGRPYPELIDRVYSHPDHQLALRRLDRIASGATGLTGLRVEEGSGDGGVGGSRAA